MTLSIRYSAEQSLGGCQVGCAVAENSQEALLPSHGICGYRMRLRLVNQEVHPQHTYNYYH